MEITCTIGLTIALTRTKITATTKMMPARANVVSPPTKAMPGTTRVTTHSATPVSAARSRKLPMPLILAWARPLVPWAQQIGVHDPAMPGACLGTQFGDLGANLPDGAGHQQLVGRAEVSAPPDSGLR